MKTMPKNMLGLLLLISIAQVSQAVFIRFEPFYWQDFSTEFNTMIDHMHKFMQPKLPKKQRELIKTAQKNLENITAEITQDNLNIIITFNNIDNAQKQTIDITFKDYEQLTWANHIKKYKILRGTIPAEHGKIQFVIGTNGIELVRLVEIKEEENKQEKSQAASYITSRESEYLSFASPVIISKETVKAQTKDNTLTITLAKKQQPENAAQKEQTKLVIDHA